MKKLINAAIIVCMPFLLQSQVFTTYTGDGSPGDLLTEFQQTPVFPGDVPQLFGFFENNVFAPMPARSGQDVSIREDNNAYFEQFVVLAFDLDRYGQISNRRIEYSNNLLMDRSFSKALDLMPLWAPAIIDSNYTDVQVYLPLRYIIIDSQIQILGWGEWLYKSSGQDFWLKLALGVVVVGIFAWFFF